ncbi:MAG: hypothetical protein H8D67_29695, partial [Deltaproteobacteria bacterium]|nr:hypothetical protein [Deltaproteobacteria bacterium]
HGTAKTGMNKAIARISSIRAAKVDAMRNLLETVKGVNIDSMTLVDDFITRKDIIKARVKGIVEGAQMVREKTEWIEGAPLTTVVMRLCLSAQGSKCRSGMSLISALDPVQLKESPHIPKRMYSEPTTHPPEAPAKKSYSSIYYNYDPTKPVSSVIFSLQRIYYKRVILPVVVTRENGDFACVYSVKGVNPRTVRTYGIVRYVDTLDQALKINELSANPLIVPVENVSDDNMLVINTKGACKIYETTRHGNDYLNKARVVISAE